MYRSGKYAIKNTDEIKKNNLMHREEVEMAMQQHRQPTG